VHVGFAHNLKQRCPCPVKVYQTIVAAAGWVDLPASASMCAS
jgi:hypothetical protein